MYFYNEKTKLNFSTTFKPLSRTEIRPKYVIKSGENECQSVPPAIMQTMLAA